MGIHNDMVNKQSNDRGLRELALFAGAGGGILGGKLLVWRTVCAVEREAYAAQVLAQRQNDGVLEPFPIWSDVCSFDGKPWRGIVDVISGGFPCQDISAAGKGAGITGERSGLWKEFARIIREVEPRFVFVENSPMLTLRGLGVVLGDLAAMGYDAEWGVLSAADVGAPHRRERIWILAYTAKGRRTVAELPGGKFSEGSFSSITDGVCDAQEDVADTESNGHIKWGEKRNIREAYGGQGWALFSVTPGTSRWEIEPNVGRVADGLAYGVDKLAAIGNGQVPLVAATAWRILAERAGIDFS